MIKRETTAYGVVTPYGFFIEKRTFVDVNGINGLYGIILVF